MAQQTQIDYYGGSRELAAMDYALAVNEEMRDLFLAGADVLQIDEPYMQARPEEARAWGGMKYLPREVAAGKMAAMVAGARIVREELE